MFKIDLVDYLVIFRVIVCGLMMLILILLCLVVVIFGGLIVVVNLYDIF